MRVRAERNAHVLFAFVLWNPAVPHYPTRDQPPYGIAWDWPSWRVVATAAPPPLPLEPALGGETPTRAEPSFGSGKADCGNTRSGDKKRDQGSQVASQVASFDDSAQAMLPGLPTSDNKHGLAPSP